MGVEKAEIEKGTMAAHVAKLEGRLEGARASVRVQEGAARAYKGAAKGIEGLFVHVQKDLAEGKIEVPGTPEATAKLLVTWLNRARGLMIHLADQATAEGLRAEGAVRGLEVALTEALRVHDEEAAKAEAILAEAGDEDNVVPFPQGRRPTGVRPGPSVVAQRRAEEAPSKPRRRRKKAPEAKPPKRRRKKGPDEA